MYLSSIIAMIVLLALQKFSAYLPYLYIIHEALKFLLIIPIGLISYILISSSRNIRKFFIRSKEEINETEEGKAIVSSFLSFYEKF